MSGGGVALGRGSGVGQGVAGDPAYGDDSPGMLGYALLMNCGPYNIPHVHAHGRVAYTHKMRFGAFRGFGVPQVTFASEQQIDEIATITRIVAACEQLPAFQQAAPGVQPDAE